MRSLDPIGVLTRDPDVPEWWTSQPVHVPLFEDELLPFTITDDLGEGGYPPDVAEAVNAFLSLGVGDRAHLGERIFKHHRDYVEALADDDDDEDAAPVDIADAAGVWPHVRPTHIYVTRRHRGDKSIHVQVNCECDWEDEHGLQLVFRRGVELVRVSDQDGHLTHADAHGLPEEASDA